MQLGNWQFSPGLWPTLATLVLLPLLLSLGLWQLDRAEQKVALQERFQQRAGDTPVSVLTADMDMDALLWRRVIVAGSFDQQHTFLLDNQVLDRQVGYYVYGIFRLDNGELVLVNRGWIKADADRSRIPAVDIPRARQQISGVLKGPPATGVLLAENTDEALDKGLYRLQKIDADNIGATYGLQLLPGIIRLDAGSGAGFVRKWPVPGSGKEKHQGYAFQWFAMAAALFIIYLAVNLKKVRK